MYELSIATGCSLCALVRILICAGCWPAATRTVCLGCVWCIFKHTHTHQHMNKHTHTAGSKKACPKGLPRRKTVLLLLFLQLPSSPLESPPKDLPGVCLSYPVYWCGRTRWAGRSTSFFADSTACLTGARRASGAESPCSPIVRRQSRKTRSLLLPRLLRPGDTQAK